MTILIDRHNHGYDLPAVPTTDRELIRYVENVHHRAFANEIHLPITANLNSRLRTTGGRCTYTRRPTRNINIQVNSHIVNELEFIEIVLHELAHGVEYQRRDDSDHNWGFLNILNTAIANYGLDEALVASATCNNQVLAALRVKRRVRRFFCDNEHCVKCINQVRFKLSQRHAKRIVDGTDWVPCPSCAAPLSHRLV